MPRRVRTGGLEIHRPGIVAVGAAHGIHHFRSPLAPFGSVEGSDALLAHQPGNVRSLTGPAGARLYVAITADAGVARAQNLAHVFNGMTVPSGRIIVSGEGIACPNDHNIGERLENVPFLRAVVHALECGVLGHCPRFVFAGEVFFKLLILRHNGVGHRCAAVVEHAGHFGPALKKRRTDESQHKHNQHGAAEEQPSLPFL